MFKHLKELHISVGLPASGKTTLFKKLINDRKGIVSKVHIECDRYRNIHSKDKQMDVIIKEAIRRFEEYTYLDGLFLTKQDINEALLIVRKERVKVDKVIIHYFRPDREKCQWNDLGRRDTNSTITIENAKIDTLEEIMEIEEDISDIKFQSKSHKVVEKEKWKVFADTNNLYTDENGIASGESWCLGGSWADCWGGGGSVSGSPQPEGCYVIDDLLEEIAPTISFLQYKKIMNECVSIDEFSEGDYYGGSTRHAKQLVNIPALYNYLVEKELIEEVFLIK